MARSLRNQQRAVTRNDGDARSIDCPGSGGYGPALAGVRAVATLRIPVGHVEAGSTDLQPREPLFPGDAPSCHCGIAQLHFAPTAGSEQNLLGGWLRAARISHREQGGRCASAARPAVRQRPWPVRHSPSSLSIGRVEAERGSSRRSAQAGRARAAGAAGCSCRCTPIRPSAAVACRTRATRSGQHRRADSYSGAQCKHHFIMRPEFRRARAPAWTRLRCSRW